MSMNSATEKFLTGLKSNDLLLKLTWDEWLAIEPPYSATQVTTTDAWTRYQRNGYDWDMHGTLIHAGKRNRSASGFRFLSRRRGQRKDHGSDARRAARIGARAGGTRIQSAGAHLSGPLPARRRMETTDRRAKSDLPQGSRSAPRRSFRPQLEMHLQRHPAGRRAAD